MIFESQYRRKALESWECDKEETKKELKEIFEKNKHLRYHPIKYVFALFMAFFIQQ